MAFLELAGVALAALLSENFILVNCMGIGTRRQSFQDPLDALRTGYSLTAVMVLGAFFSWLADFLVITRFGWQHYRLLFLALLIPGLVAGLRLFLRTCLPELSRRMDDNLAAVSTNCAAL
ncbi:MAG: Rnf-Nqr domain containing protein, partial [Lawsonibacter sp.]